MNDILQDSERVDPEATRGQGEVADDEDRRILDPGHPHQIARRFLLLNYRTEDIDTLRYRMGSFFTYREAAGCYEEREQDAVRAELYRFLAASWMVTVDGKGEPQLVPFQATKRIVDNVIDALRAEVYVEHPSPSWVREDYPGTDPLDYIATPAGLLWLPGRLLLPPTPGFFTTTAIEFPYDEAAPAPTTWLKFLATLWPKDQESIDTLQEWFGYLLTARTDQQKILMAVGPTRSGKGVIARTAKKVVGAANTCAPTLASLAKDFGLQNLIGKSVALTGDARIGGRTDTTVIAERLLSIAGEDPQSIPRKYLADWNGHLRTRFVISTNELPVVLDQSGAFASRFIVLALTESFLGREDHTLESRIEPELPGILNWALDGLERLQTRGRFLQPASALELIEALNDLASPIKAFVRDCCDVGPKYEATPKDLFGAWEHWCESSGREHAGSLQVFGRNLAAAVPGLKTIKPRIDRTQVRRYQGIRLKPGVLTCAPRNLALKKPS